MYQCKLSQVKNIFPKAWNIFLLFELQLFDVPFAVIDATTASGMDPEFVAGRILEAIERKEEDVILADFAANAAVCLRTFLPGLLFKILKRRANKEDNSKSKKE